MPPSAPLHPLVNINELHLQKPVELFFQLGPGFCAKNQEMWLDICFKGTKDPAVVKKFPQMLC